MKNNKEEYQWSPSWGSRIAHLPILPIVDELKTIEEIHGKLTPELVVDSARNKKSTLHTCFEWDDSLAAKKWRLREASTILGHIEVKIIRDNEPKMVRAFIISQTGGKLDGGEPIYHTISETDEDSKRMCLRIVLSNLNASVKKLVVYSEYADAIKKIEEAIELLSKTENKLVVAV